MESELPNKALAPPASIYRSLRITTPVSHCRDIFQRSLRSRRRKSLAGRPFVAPTACIVTANTVGVNVGPANM
ncbi:jg16035 [Pararge aegeria aegeria]|uniref:Jg16035 protein n=1 Tax=Pararge aegeria aegeria TaxID=348720 RepID=A0A8S4SIN8_9NEOP|nr:jg16035 [Pararge aegeria aegeria]